MANRDYKDTRPQKERGFFCYPKHAGFSLFILPVSSHHRIILCAGLIIFARYLLFFAVGALLWRLGGWHWKWLRRYVLPFLLTASVAAEDMRKDAPKKPLLKKLVLFPALVAAFSLGYGEKHPYWRKFLVGFSWIAPALAINGFSWLRAAAPVIWISMFYLSNYEKTARYFKWHYVEIVNGGIVGMAYA